MMEGGKLNRRMEFEHIKRPSEGDPHMRKNQKTLNGPYEQEWAGRGVRQSVVERRVQYLGQMPLRR